MVPNLTKKYLVQMGGKSRNANKKNTQRAKTRNGDKRVWGGEDVTTRRPQPSQEGLLTRFLHTYFPGKVGLFENVVAIGEVEKYLLGQWLTF